MGLPISDKLYTMGEEVAHAITHGLGAVLSIIGLTVLVARASMYGDTWHLVAVSIFGSTLVMMYTASTLYHSIPLPRAKHVLRVIDHSLIYFLIAGTYTPLALLGLGGWQGTALTLATWGLALIGLVMKLCFFPRWDRAGFVLYLGQGWLGLLAIWPLVHSLPPLALALLLAGGLTYTVGTVFYHRDGLPYARAIWHLHVLAAAAAHYVAVILVTQTH